MTHQIVVDTILGTFKSKSVESDDKSLQEIVELLEQINEMDRFNIELENGDILYMPRGVIQQSIFKLVKR